MPLPEWVPAYPGEHRVLKSSDQLKGANERGQYSFNTRDLIHDSAASFAKLLEAAGFEVTRESAAADGSRVVLLEAAATPEGGGSERISVRMMAQGKETMVHLDYFHEESAGEKSVENKLFQVPAISITQQMPCGSDQVFVLLHDYSRRLEWDTLLRSAELTQGHITAGPRATSLCLG